MTRKLTNFVGRSHPYIHTDELADLLNSISGRDTWNTQRARRMLLREQALKKVGGRWVTTRSMLRDAFPEIWAELLLRLAEED